MSSAFVALCCFFASCQRDLVPMSAGGWLAGWLAGRTDGRAKEEKSSSNQLNGVLLELASERATKGCLRRLCHRWSGLMICSLSLFAPPFGPAIKWPDWPSNARPTSGQSSWGAGEPLLWRGEQLNNCEQGEKRENAQASGRAKAVGCLQRNSWTNPKARPTVSVSIKQATGATVD